MIYTTNAIESLNYQLRKVTKNRGHFPNDLAVVKLLWLAICNIEDKRARERAKERWATHNATPSTGPARRRPGHHELETSPRATRHRLPRPHQRPHLNTMTPAAYTEIHAISNASMARSDRNDFEACQPTTIRENTSTTNARYTHPE